MKKLAILLFLAMLAVPAAEPQRPAVAQAGPQCGVPPMKPASCLGGAWVCRCYAGGQVCDWELVGCDTIPGVPRPSGEPRPGTDPTRPDTFGR